MSSRPKKDRHKVPGERVKVNVRIAKPKNAKRKAGDTTNYFRIFTDGACTGNGKKWARAGLGVHFPKGQHPDISLPFTDPPITNQRAELAAILMAIQTVLDKELLDGYDELVIYSDSDYSIKCVTLWAPSWQRNGWKRKATSNKPGSKIEPLKNLDLIRAIYDLLPNLPIPLVFVHVMAHTEQLDYRSIHNAVADKLASEGIRKLEKYKGGSANNRTKNIRKNSKQK